ncbi:PQQ-dependent sugar dehydrogenase [Candidatus Saccharibacteria bacterium]|nr:PQQ-dependent sugar dehydrogenase [Candidatus Saccharibacteria bacterium]
MEGLTNAWDVVFLPDQTLLFSERAGMISKLSGGKKTELLRVPNVLARGEGGLLGLAVDPDYDQNNFIYACYNTAQDVRVSRWIINADATGLIEQKDIVTGMPISSGRHSGCRPGFGADGNLWIGTGETLQSVLILKTQKVWAVRFYVLIGKEQVYPAISLLHSTTGFTVMDIVTLRV